MKDKEMEAYISGFISAVNLYKVAVAYVGIYDAEQALDYAAQSINDEYTLIDVFSVVHDCKHEIVEQITNDDMNAVNKIRSIFLHNETLKNAAQHQNSREDTALDVLTSIQLLVDSIKSGMYEDEVQNRWAIMH